MINESQAKKYCCEDISLIENYAQAMNDESQVWDCHHRGEILPCGRFSRTGLKKFGLYWKRPAAELIFLTKAEHSRLHQKGRPKSAETKAKLSEANSGANHYLFGKHHSVTTKAKLSEALKGANHPMFGKHHSEEARAKMSAALCKRIQQLTLNGELVKEWPSLTAAAKETRIASSSISSCCTGALRQAGGFKWRYVDV